MGRAGQTSEARREIHLVKLGRLGRMVRKQAGLAGSGQGSHVHDISGKVSSTGNVLV